MNFHKMKKDELITLAEKHDVPLDPNYNKDQIVDTLINYEITAEDPGKPRESKKERQTRLKAR